MDCVHKVRWCGMKTSCTLANGTTTRRMASALAASKMVGSGTEGGKMVHLVMSRTFTDKSG